MAFMTHPSFFVIVVSIQRHGCLPYTIKGWWKLRMTAIAFRLWQHRRHGDRVTFDVKYCIQATSFTEKSMCLANSCLFVCLTINLQSSLSTWMSQKAQRKDLNLCVPGHRHSFHRYRRFPACSCHGLCMTLLGSYNLSLLWKLLW